MNPGTTGAFLELFGSAPVDVSDLLFAQQGSAESRGQLEVVYRLSLGGLRPLARGRRGRRRLAAPLALFPRRAIPKPDGWMPQLGGARERPEGGQLVEDHCGFCLRLPT